MHGAACAAGASHLTTQMKAEVSHITMTQVKAEVPTTTMGNGPDGFDALQEHQISLLRSPQNHNTAQLRLRQKHQPPQWATNLMALRQQLSNTLPDATSAPLQGESEHGVGSPAGILLVVDDIGDGAVHIYCGHTLT